MQGKGPARGATHYYQYAQKIFEFGDVGAVHWGLGGLFQTSFRTLFAEIADEAKKTEPDGLLELAALASSVFWKTYSALFESEIKRAGDLHAKGDLRTDDENGELDGLLSFSGGICLAGRWGNSRRPQAFEIAYGPLLDSPPKPEELEFCTVNLWGWPNIMYRLIRGMDYPLFSRILDSEKWTGTPEELMELVSEGALGQPYDLPLREAIDCVYASLYSTIKALKFSHWPEVCGGPIEMAVISTDRPFRWVRHKSLGEAIGGHRTQEDRL